MPELPVHGAHFGQHRPGVLLETQSPESNFQRSLCSSSKIRPENVGIPQPLQVTRAQTLQGPQCEKHHWLHYHGLPEVSLKHFFQIHTSLITEQCEGSSELVWECQGLTGGPPSKLTTRIPGSSRFEIPHYTAVSWHFIIHSEKFSGINKSCSTELC